MGILTVIETHPNHPPAYYTRWDRAEEHQKVIESLDQWGLLVLLCEQPERASAFDVGFWLGERGEQIAWLHYSNRYDYYPACLFHHSAAIHFFVFTNGPWPVLGRGEEML